MGMNEVMNMNLNYYIRNYENCGSVTKECYIHCLITLDICCSECCKYYMENGYDMETCVLADIGKKVKWKHI